MPRKTGATTYFVKDIDPEAWEKFKQRADKEGRGLRWVVLKLVAMYSQVGLEALEKAVRKA